MCRPTEAVPSLESDRLSKVLVVSDSEADKGRDMGRSLENLGQKGSDGDMWILGRGGCGGRLNAEKEESEDRHGEGRGVSFVVVEVGDSVDEQMLYLKERSSH